MSEERVKILEMLSSGKISVEEADKLLERIAPNKMLKKTTTTTSTKSDSKKFLKIAIQDGEDTTVNINLPIALAKVGLDMAAQKNADVFSKQNIDVDSLIKLIEEGAEGEIVNIKDKDTTVKIYID